MKLLSGWNTLGSQPSIAASCDIGSEKVVRDTWLRHILMKVSSRRGIGIQGLSVSALILMMSPHRSIKETSLEQAGNECTPGGTIAQDCRELLESSVPVSPGG